MEIVMNKIGKLICSYCPLHCMCLILFLNIILKMLRKIQYLKHMTNNIDNICKYLVMN